MPRPSSISESPAGRYEIQVESFGYRYRPTPPEATLAIDLRLALPSLTSTPESDALTGLYPRVAAGVLALPGVLGLLDNAETLALALYRLHSPPRGQRWLTRVCFGSETGRHRSVALATALRNRLARRGIGTSILHHDILRPLPDTGR